MKRHVVPTPMSCSLLYGSLLDNNEINFDDFVITAPLFLSKELLLDPKPSLRRQLNLFSLDKIKIKKTLCVTNK